MKSRIPRSIQPTIASQLRSNKVILLVGARRVGKTVLMNQLADSFDGTKLLLNGDDLSTADLLNDRRVASYKRWLGDTQLLLIDEAQVIPEVGRSLKLLIDSFPDLTIFATGSSAFDLANRAGEPLVGRQLTHTLYPLAQLELSATETYFQTRDQLTDRLIFGSYPDVVQMENTNDRIDYLKGMVSSYLLKDILLFEQVRNAHKMLQLLQLVAYQAGSEVSTDELSRQLQIDRNTVVRYLDLFTKVFILFRLGGYSNNLRKEVTKSSKWYFFDNGIRNALINNFSLPDQRNDMGALWENYLVSERIKRNAYLRSQAIPYFWRTYDQQELDWLEETNGQLSAFEMKWNTNRVRFPKAFQTAYPEASLSVVNPDNYLEFVT
ncbi:ATP-binding protein [Spirosoma sp. KCTC 42546]|uniref:ATP-binding protein n=1 Tax=Spirosoma sp. KCTC 42546 TaxID=2520506 RepID=UPI0011582686|nr:ATP-binding protein [Spirosoma sp. KCTC 42546]QDK83361.1 ATP-binding protein [Spirosoma sp. KCTC 42546]